MSKTDEIPDHVRAYMARRVLHAMLHVHVTWVLSTDLDLERRRAWLTVSSSTLLLTTTSSPSATRVSMDVRKTTASEAGM